MIPLCTVVAVLFLALVVSWLAYHRIWEEREALEAQINDLTEENAQLVDMVCELRYRHRDFVITEEDDWLRVSTGITDLVGSARTRGRSREEV